MKAKRITAHLYEKKKKDIDFIVKTEKEEMGQSCFDSISKVSKSSVFSFMKSSFGIEYELISVKNKSVGIVEIQRDVFDGGNRVVINNIYILPKHRKRNIAKMYVREKIQRSDWFAICDIIQRSEGFWESIMFNLLTFVDGQTVCVSIPTLCFGYRNFVGNPAWCFKSEFLRKMTDEKGKIVFDHITSNKNLPKKYI